MGLHTWATTAAAHGHLTPTRAAAFTTNLTRATQTGHFLYAVTFFLTSATKPA